uniref:Predicted protein n=1 Tax=Hordeum vulgare subsp. vulgare TaxID=112509 RepID=F2CTE0_HORVV|nr:predicted protein [Hordeum vulgare subsp. vulgare]
MKRANKVVLAQPAAAAAPPRLLPRAPRPIRGDGGEAYRTSQRYQSLLQDYKELLKETAAKKNRLHLEKLKKQRLSAEVKFLRRRYQSMSGNPSQTSVYRLKNPAMVPTTSRTTVWVDHHRPIQAVGSSSKGHQPVQQQRQHLVPRASPIIDLNEACELSSSEETEEFHGYEETARADKVNKYMLQGNVAGPSDSKMSAFWDARNPAVARAGKRKISWQDQLALRV